jgi:hypothetical protein
MSGGFTAAPMAITEAAKGIEDTIAELRTLGTVGTAATGRGITTLAMGVSALGHDGVASALADFCVCWDWGVRGLVRSGQRVVDGLNETGVAYQTAENDAASLAKRVMFDLVGDPMGSSEAASAAPWDEILPSFDRSPESFARSTLHIATTWQETGQDVVDNSTVGSIGRALRGENPLAGQIADVAGLAEIGD